MNLPPLPTPVIPASELVESSSGVFAALYLREQMQAYGQQCRDAALEEAALFIENGSFMHDQSPAKLFADQLAPKIRSLK